MAGRPKGSGNKAKDETIITMNEPFVGIGLTTASIDDLYSEDEIETENNEATVENINKATIEIPEVKQVVQWKPDLQRMICIKNITNNDLIYKSKRQMGYTVEWQPKSTNYLELAEFVNLKNTDRRFVTEPWIRIIEDDEVEILKYANIYQYYEEILKVDVDIFKLDFERFQKRFSKLPMGYKNNLVKQAAIMIGNGTLDSIRIKNYIEKEMDVDLDILMSSLTSDSDGKNNQNQFIDIQ